MFTEDDLEYYWKLYVEMCHNDSYNEKTLDDYCAKMKGEGLLEIDEAYYLYSRNWGGRKPNRAEFDQFVKEKYTKLAQLLRGGE